MRYVALAADFDGTLATHGLVSEEVIEALHRLSLSGRKLVMVTGRELDDLERVFDRLDLFDRVVAENGGLLYRPADKERRVLTDAPNEAFVAMLRERGVDPLSVGEAIVATWHPNEEVVLECIRDLGLELQVIFNKGAVMVLPSGVNKSTGLAAALEELGLSPHNVVGVGDAENDHAFLSACECAVATENAVPALKDACDVAMARRNGEGVSELIERMITDDLADVALPRRGILVGSAADDAEVRLDPYGHNVLVAGPSESGKSTFTTGFIERLCADGYQVCVVDPEGDYSALTEAITLGDATRAPTPEEAAAAIERPGSTIVVNLLGLPMDDRPGFLETFFPRVQELRARTGRPHWVVVDEAHHMLHPERVPRALTLPRELGQFLFITIHPDHLAAEVLGSVQTLVATGSEPGATIETFATELGEAAPALPVLEEGRAVLWDRRRGEPVAFTIAAPHAERRRHVRKYAEGELSDDRSFYFRGPSGTLNLRAQNLDLFLQIGDGVDDETWAHHLRAGDYSRWFREDIKDESLAEEVEAFERDDLTPAESRAKVRAAIEDRYTAAP